MQKNFIEFPNSSLRLIRLVLSSDQNAIFEFYPAKPQYDQISENIKLQTSNLSIQVTNTPDCIKVRVKAVEIDKICGVLQYLAEHGFVSLNEWDILNIFEMQLYDIKQKFLDEISQPAPKPAASVLAKHSLNPPPVDPAVALLREVSKSITAEFDKFRPLLQFVREKNYSVFLRNISKETDHRVLPFIELLFLYKKQYPEIIKFDINEQNKSEQRAAVHYAALSGTKEVYEFLVQRGANTLLTDKDGNTALHYAERFAESKVVPR